MPGKGVVVVVEGVKGVKYTPKPPGMYENGEKNGQFPALIDFKIAKNTVLTKST